MKKAVIYARVSTKRQSLLRQINDCKEYANANGYTIERIFSESCSGLKKRRKEFDMLLSYCICNPVDTVIILELSRIGRKADIILDFVETMTKYKINVSIAASNINTLKEDKSEDVVVKAALIQFAYYCESECKRIEERLRSGREYAIQQGVKMGSPKGSRMTAEDYLTRYPNVIKNLNKGYSIRDVAKMCNISIKTVQKIVKITQYDLHSDKRWLNGHRVVVNAIKQNPEYNDTQIQSYIFKNSYKYRVNVNTIQKVRAILAK